MKKIKEVFVKVLKKIRSVCKLIYSFISVISTLAIFSAVILFCFGKNFFGNICDDDLTMQRIKEQIPNNLTISDIYMEDIHGFGNESLIILASDSKIGNKIANQLLIFDKVENGILNQMYNFWGYGSNYKCSYLFSLEYLDKDWLKEFNLNPSELGFLIEIVDVIDLTGDLSKEIVVSFTPLDEWGSVAGNGGYYDTGIFSYSNEKHSYYLMGTYPSYNSDNTLKRKIDDRNSYNKTEKFKLEGGLDKFYSEYFAIEEWGKTVLVRTEILVAEDESYAGSPHRHRISVYEPIYDTENHKLKWKEILSKCTDDYRKYCSKDYIKKFLKKNYINISKWES